MRRRRLPTAALAAADPTASIPGVQMTHKNWLAIGILAATFALVVFFYLRAQGPQSTGASPGELDVTEKMQNDPAFRKSIEDRVKEMHGIPTTPAKKEPETPAPVGGNSGE